MKLSEIKAYGIIPVVLMQREKMLYGELVRPEHTEKWERGDTEIFYFGDKRVAGMAKGTLLLLGNEKRCTLIDVRERKILSKTWGEAFEILKNHRDDSEEYERIKKERMDKSWNELSQMIDQIEFAGGIPRNFSLNN